MWTEFGANSTGRAAKQAMKKAVVAIRELSLHVMDIAQNSIAAGATLLEIAEHTDTAAGTLTLCVRDNGRGMTAEQLAAVTDPFYTTRTTRPVGLGVPLLKMAGEMTGGSFQISSSPGRGTQVCVRFVTTHIDMPAVGDMTETVLLLVACNPDMDIVYKKAVDGTSFVLDTRDMRKELGPEVPLNHPDVLAWMRRYLTEQQACLQGE